MPGLAENLPYFSRDMDLSMACNMVVGTMESIQFEYFNLIAEYMLHALAKSQSMGKLLYVFKNVRKTLMRMTGLSRSRETMAYAISLSISCVCLHANDDILKGRASAAY